jgi:hypothetical protein
LPPCTGRKLADGRSCPYCRPCPWPWGDGGGGMVSNHRLVLFTHALCRLSYPAVGRKVSRPGVPCLTRRHDTQGVLSMIPAQWLPPLPEASGDGWLPVYYEFNEHSGVLRQGEYRVVADQVWARNDAGMRFLPRDKSRADEVVARRCCGSWITGCDRAPRRRLATPRLSLGPTGLRGDRYAC